MLTLPTLLTDDPNLHIQSQVLEHMAVEDPCQPRML